MRYWKITNTLEYHFGLEYRDGRVDDPIPFCDDATKVCGRGGIYYADTVSILEFAGRGPWIREVTLPSDARVVSVENKYRASSVILGHRRAWCDVIVLRELLEGGAYPHQHALLAAIDADALDAVRLLLDFGADVAPYSYAIHSAAVGGNVAIIRVLIDAGARATRDALHVAVMHDDMSVAHVLIDAGADVSQALRLARTPHMARMLIEAGADVYDDVALRNAIIYHDDAVADIIRASRGER
jgi:hypothetical protein